MANGLRWAASLVGALGAAMGCAQEIPFDSTTGPLAGADAAADTGAGGGSVLDPGGGGVYVAAGGSVGGMTGVGSGGMPGAGGELGAGGERTGNGCQQGAKRCGGVCVLPQPQIGCSMTDCSACPLAPDNADAVCMGEACGFTCHEGLQPSADGTFCEVPAPVGAGGAGAGGAPPVGSGGSAPSCDPSSCPECSLLLQPCCTSSGQCGCEGSIGLIQCR